MAEIETDEHFADDEQHGGEQRARPDAVPCHFTIRHHFKCHAEQQGDDDNALFINFLIFRSGPERLYPKYAHASTYRSSLCHSEGAVL